ncbi:MAG: PhzF family phenazine biosynthesis protein [Acidobacteria bacterium]|jgi:PhzF family phenazine biosynthesis protein|nr:PhzF family phenazine biosynthesis protein [Acidobacteriota bacterium]
MKIAIYQVDAFTDKLFGGNPAAVCPLEKWLDDRTMQNIAIENNLAETAFYVKDGDGFHIRWFTPALEIDLCGHATLASAHVIFNHSDFKGNLITFKSQSGPLKVSKDINTDGLLTLDFPANKPAPVENIPPGLIEALDLKPVALSKARDLLALYETEEEILALKPNFRMIAEELKKIGCLGMIVTAPGKTVDFVSRFFAPLAGIDEDPVTGSAHTILIPYWAERLNKKKLHAYQLSQRRGELFCEMAGDRVFIAGKAVTYLKGEIYI